MNDDYIRQRIHEILLQRIAMGGDYDYEGVQLVGEGMRAGTMGGLRAGLIGGAKRCPRGERKMRTCKSEGPCVPHGKPLKPRKPRQKKGTGIIGGRCPKGKHQMVVRTCVDKGTKRVKRIKVTRQTRGPSAWINHVREVAAELGIPYGREAMTLASKTWKKE